MRQPLCGAAASWNTFFRLPKYVYKLSKDFQTWYRGQSTFGRQTKRELWYYFLFSMVLNLNNNNNKKKITFVGRSPVFALYFSPPTRSQFSKGQRWIDSDRAKTEALGETPVPVPLCPPQIPHGLAGDRNRTAATTVWRLTTLNKLTL